MLLSELTKNLVYAAIGNVHDLDIADLVYDSRKATSGCMYVCISGHAVDGHRYAEDAAARGAAVLVVERKLDLACPQLLVDNSRQALARLAVNFYRSPAERLLLAGVTGTNGKTTIVHMLKSIAEIVYKSALIGTVGVKIGGGEYQALANTSPESLELQALLDSMDRQGVGFVATEVSSHGLKEHRLDYCGFDLAIFNNLTRDHLNYHKTMRDYFSCKAKLFTMLKNNGKACALINIDDSYGRQLYQSLDRSSTLSFAIHEQADCQGKILETSATGTLMSVSYQGQSATFNLPLCFKYNAYNALASASGAFALGFAPDMIVSGLEALPQVPGRMERLDFEQNFTVFVDYAHTPDGLEQALAGLSAIKTNRIILVFGCVGDGDRGKRPRMARIAEKYADLVVVTTDQPKFEEPEAIIRDIVRGFRGDRFMVYPDRTEAVTSALKQAKQDDIVLLAGLGHEKYQLYRDKPVPYSDYEAVAGYLLKLPEQETAAAGENQDRTQEV